MDFIVKKSISNAEFLMRHLLVICAWLFVLAANAIAFFELYLSFALSGYTPPDFAIAYILWLCTFAWVCKFIQRAFEIVYCPDETITASINKEETL